MPSLGARGSMIGCVGLWRVRPAVCRLPKRCALCARREKHGGAGAVKRECYAEHAGCHAKAPLFCMALLFAMSFSSWRA